MPKETTGVFTACYAWYPEKKKKTHFRFVWVHGRDRVAYSAMAPSAVDKFLVNSRTVGG